MGKKSQQKQVPDTSAVVDSAAAVAFSGGDNGGTVPTKGREIQKVQREAKIYNPLRPRLLSLKDAGRYLGRSVWGMRELFWANKIPWVKDGKKIFFDIQDLDGYVEKNKSSFI